MHTSSSALFRRLLLAVTLTLGGIVASTSLRAQTTIVFETRYKVDNISMWNGGTPTVINYQDFLGVRWNESSGNIGGMAYGIFGEPYGLILNASTRGEIGFDVMFKSTSGTMNIDLPNTITLDVPDLTVAGPQTITISQQRNQAPGANIITSLFPEAQFSVGAKLNVDIAIHADVGYGFGRSQGTFDNDALIFLMAVALNDPLLVFTDPFHNDIPLVSYNVNNNGKIALLGGLFGVTEKNLDKGFTIPLNTNTFTPTNLKGKTTPTAVEFGSISYTNYNLDTASGSSLTSVKQQDEILAVRANLLGLTALGLGLPINPFQPKFYIPGTPILLDATLLNVEAGITLGLRSSISLSPQTHLVLQSNYDVTYSVHGQIFTTTYLDVPLPDSGDTSFIQVIGKPTDPVELAKLQIYPSIYVNPSATSSLDIGIGADLRVRALSAGIGAFGLSGGVGPLFDETYPTGSIYFNLWENNFSLAGLGAFSRRYRTFDSLINNGIGIGEDLEMAPLDHVTLVGQTQAFATPEIPLGATIELRDSGFNNTTSLTIAEGATLNITNASEASLRGLQVAATGIVAIDKTSKLTNTGTRNADGTFILDANGERTPLFVDAAGHLGTGNYIIAGQLFYFGPNISSIGEGAALSLLDNDVISSADGLLHLINDRPVTEVVNGNTVTSLKLINNPLLALHTLDGALSLAGPSLVLPQSLTLGGILSLEAGSTVTATGLTGTGSGLTAGTLLLDHNTWVDVRGAGGSTFGNVDIFGTLSNINLFLGDATGGGQLRYSGENIKRNETTVVLSGAPQSGGYLARKNGNSLEEGLRTLNENVGSLSLFSGAQLNLTGNLTNRSTILVSGNSLLTATGINNDGSLTIAGGQIVAPTFTNTKTFEIYSGAQLVTDTLTNLSTVNSVTNVLTGGGTWIIGGNLDAGSRPINGLGLNTSLLLRTGYASINTANAGLANFSYNAGTLSVLEGAQLRSAASLTNVGTINLSGTNSWFSTRGVTTNTGIINVGTDAFFDTVGGDSLATSYWATLPNASSLLVNASNHLSGGGAWNIGGYLRYYGPTITGVAAGTVLSFIPPWENPELTSSSYDTNRSGSTFLRYDGTTTSPGLVGLESVAGYLTLHNNAAIRTDASFDIKSGGVVTVYPDATLHIAGPSFTIQNGGNFDFGGNLVLGGIAGQTTTFYLPDNFKFDNTSEVQLGRIVNPNGIVYNTTGSGNLAAKNAGGTWTNEAALIYGVGTISGASVRNEAVIYAAGGTLNVNATDGTFINLGRMGSFFPGSGSASLDISNATINQTAAGSTAKGLLDFQSYGHLSNVTVNGGSVFITGQGKLTLTTSTLNTESFINYGELTLGTGTTTVNGTFSNGWSGYLKLDPNALFVTEVGKSFNNMGTLELNGGTMSGGGLVNDSRIRVSATSRLTSLSNSKAGVVNIFDGTQLTLDLGANATFENRGYISLALASRTNGLGTLSFNQNTTLTGGGGIQLGGEILYGSPDDFTAFNYYWDSLSGHGNLTAGTSGDITLYNTDQTIQGAGNIGGGHMTIVNGLDGYIHAQGSGHTLVIDPNSGGFRNLGYLDVDAGATLRIKNNFVSFVDGTLVEGNYRIAGTLELPEIGSFDNIVNILFDGPNSRLIDPNGNPVSIGNNKATGQLTIGSGFNYTNNTNLTNPFKNDGRITIKTGSTFTVTGNYFSNYNYLTHTLNDGVFEILGGNLKFDGADLFTNNTSLTFGGANPQITNGSGLNGLANFSRNNAGATLNFTGVTGYTLASSAPTFTNAGTLNVNGGSTFTLGGATTLYNSGLINVSGNSTLVLPESITFFDNRGALGETGQLRVADGSTLFIKATKAAGLIDPSTGAVNTGLYQIGGTLKFNTAFTNLGADVTLYGPNARFADATGATLNELSLITVSGKLTFGATNYSLKLPTNDGHLYVGGAAVVDGNGVSHNVGGALTLTNASLGGAGSLILQNGTVPSGIGGRNITSFAALTLAPATGSVFTLNSKIEGEGRIDPASSATTLTIGANGVLAASGGQFGVASTSLLVNLPVTNLGRVEVNPYSSLVFTSGVSLAGGVFDIGTGGSLGMVGTPLTTLPSGFTLNLHGYNSAFNNYTSILIQGTNVQLGGLSSVASNLTSSSATITLSDQAQFRVGNNFTNLGSIILNDRGQLESSGGIVNQGLVTINGGYILATGFYNLGTVRAQGTVLNTIDGYGNVYIYGTGGVLNNTNSTFTGRTIVESGATLEIQSAGGGLGSRPAGSVPVNQLELQAGSSLLLRDGGSLEEWRNLSYANNVTIAGSEFNYTIPRIDGNITGTGLLNIGGVAARLNTTGAVNLVGNLRLLGGSNLGGTITGGSGSRLDVFEGPGGVSFTNDYADFHGTLAVSDTGYINLGNGGTTGSFDNAAWDINAQLLVNRTGNLTLGRDLTGGSTGYLALGGGVQATNGANFNFSGTTGIGLNSQLTLTKGSIGAIENYGTFTTNTLTSVSVGGALSGSGTFRMIGSGTTILASLYNSSIASLTNETGTLQIGNGSAIPGNTASLNVAIANTGTVAFNHTGTLNFFGDLTGTGNLVLQKGLLTIIPNQTFTGKTTVTGGTLGIYSDTNLGVAPSSFVADQLVLNGGKLEFKAGFNLNANRGVYIGEQGGTVIGSTTLGAQLSGVGQFTASGGSLNALLGTNTSSLGFNATNGAFLVLDNQGQDATITTLSSDTNSYTSMAGAGKITNGTNVGSTFNGRLLVSAETTADLRTNGTGIYQVAGTLLAQSSQLGSVVGSGLLRIHTASSTANSVSIKNVQLDGVALTATDYQVENTVFDNAGLLILNGDGTGTNVTVNGGGGLSAPNHKLTITSSFTGDGVFLLHGNSTLELDDVFTVTPNLYLQQSGTLRLINETDLTFANRIDGQANSSIVLAGSGSVFLNSNFNAVNQVTVGETKLYLGTGGTTGALAGAISVAKDGQVIYYRSNNATVDSAITGEGGLAHLGTGQLTINTAQAYTGDTTIRTGAGTLFLANGGSVAGNIVNNASLEFQPIFADLSLGKITGTGSVTHSGSRTVTLGGGSTYSGGTTLTAQGGKLIVTGASAISGGASIAAGTTLRLEGTSTISGTVALTSSEHQVATLDLASDGDYAVTAAITGDGAVVKNGDGTATISGVPTFTGGYGLNSGTLAFHINNTLTMDNLITGSGGFAKVYDGTLILTGNSRNFFGTTTVADGTLQIGNGGATGALGGSFALAGVNSRLVFNRGSATSISDSPVADSVSGIGRLVQTGTAELYLTGSSTHTGGTFINSGTGITLLGSLAGNVSNAGTFTFNRDDEGIYAGSISGAGNVIQAGFGKITLNGENTYSGTTTITANTTLAVGPTGSLSGAIINDGTYEVIANSTSGDRYLNSNVTGNGAVILSGGGTVFTENNLGYTGSTTVSTGTTFKFVTAPTYTKTLSTQITGGGNFVRDSGGTLIVTRNSVLGGTVTNGIGTLQFGDGVDANHDATITGLGGFINQGNLVFNFASNVQTFNTNISDPVLSGTIRQSGGNLTINSSLTASKLIVDAGRVLTIGAAGTYNAGLQVDGTLYDLRAGDLTLDHGIYGESTGQFIHNGTGSLTLREASRFAGTLVTGGALIIGNSPFEHHLDRVQAASLSNSGQLTLTGDNSSGLTSVTNLGFLTLGNGGETGSLVGNLFNNGRLTINHSDTVYLGSNLVITADTGLGIIRQLGTGTTVIQDFANAGAFEAMGGTLAFDYYTADRNASIITSLGGNALFSGSFTHANYLGGNGLITIGRAASSEFTAAAGDITFSNASNLYGGSINILAGSSLTLRDSFDTLTNNQTIAGLLSGGGDLAFNYTDAINLPFLNSPDANTGKLFLGSGSTLTGTIATNALLVSSNGSVASNVLFNNTDPLLAAKARVLEFTSDGDVTFNGTLNVINHGQATLRQAGTGTLTLDTLFAGNVEITQGTFKLGQLASFTKPGAQPGDPSTYAALSLANISSATFDMSAAGTGNTLRTVSLSSLSGGGQILLGANTLAMEGYANLTYAGSISGSGGLVKNSGGIFALTGTNTFSGGIALNAGTLVLGANALGSAPAAFDADYLRIADFTRVDGLDGLTFAANQGITFNANALFGTQGTVTINSLITGNGSLHLMGKLNTDGSGVAADGRVVLNTRPGGNVQLVVEGGTLVLGSANAVNIAKTTFLADTAFDLNGHDWSTAMNAERLSITNSGARNTLSSTLTVGSYFGLNGDITFTGDIDTPTTVSLSTGGNVILGDSAASKLNSVSINGGSLQAATSVLTNLSTVGLGGNLVLTDSGTLNTSISAQNGSVLADAGTSITVNGNIDVSSGGINAGGAGNLTLVGNLGNGQGSFMKVGSGNLDLTNITTSGWNNANSGARLGVSEGTLTTTTGILAGRGLIVNGTGTLVLTDANALTLRTLDGDGTLSLTTRDLIVNLANSATFSGTLTASNVTHNASYGFGGFENATQIYGTLNANSLNVNAGNIVVTDALNVGSINVSAGDTHSGNGDVSNYNGLTTTLTGISSNGGTTLTGSFNINGTVRLTGGSALTSNANNLTIAGPSAKLFDDQGTTQTLSHIATNTGLINLYGGASVTGAAPVFTNTGNVYISGASWTGFGVINNQTGTNSRFDLNNTTLTAARFNQISGTFVMSNSTFNGTAGGNGASNPGFNVTGGTITANGTITGGLALRNSSLNFGGNFVAGTLAVTGGVNLGEGSRLYWDTGPTSDLFQVSRTAATTDGVITFTATAANPVILRANNTSSGNLPGFNPAETGSWIVATTTDGFSGFSSDQFVTDASTFHTLITGHFGVTTVGNDLVLRYDLSHLYNTSGGDVTVSNPLAAMGLFGGLRKSGTGTLTLAAANLYTGATSLDGGTLVIAHDGALGAGNLVLNGGTLQSNGTARTFANLVNLTNNSTIGGADNLTFTGLLLNLGNSKTLTLTNTGTTSFAGVNLNDGVNNTTVTFNTTGGAVTINGPIVSTSTLRTGNLTKTGVGTLILKGANTYNGTTNVNAGTLRFAQQVSLYNNDTTRWTAANLAVASGATAVFNVGGAGEFNAANIATLSALGTSTRGFRNGSFLGLDTTNATGGAFAYNGNLVNTNAGANVLGIVKSGPGTLVLSGANTYTGTTTISAGTLQFAKQTSLYNNVTANWTATNLVAATGATAAFNVGGTGEFNANDIDTLKSLGTATGGFANGSFLGFDTTNAANGVFVYNGNLTNAGANALGLVKLGTGTLELGGANTYSGATNVNAGTLRLGSATALSANTTLNVATGATFDSNGYAQAFAKLEGTGAINVGSTGITVSPATTNIYSGSLTGTGGLTMNGTGTLVLNNSTNNFSGPVTISSGTLEVGTSGALSSGLNVSLANTATLALANHSTTVGALTGSGAVTLGSATLTLAPTSGTNTFAGTINGTGGVTVTGGGTVVLSGTSNYSGATSVSSASLIVNGSSAVSDFNIGSGGILGGSGTVGDLTLSAGSTLTPGNSPGTLHVDGNATWSGGANYNWQLQNATGVAGTGYDLVSISGSLTIAATSTSRFAINILSIISGDTAGNAINFNSAINSSYTIASASGGVIGFDANAFTINASGFTNNVNGGSWNLSQVGNNIALNFAAVSAIPEPSTYAAIFGALVLGLAAYRRRQAR